MGSSKYEFDTCKKKKFKKNKLEEREYTVGCVPYETSPLVSHREDAVRKEHSVFVLVRQQISHRQHGPPLTAMCKVRESNHDVEHRDESVILVGGRPYRGFHDCYLLQSHRGSVVPI